MARDLRILAARADQAAEASRGEDAGAGDDEEEEAGSQNKFQEEVGSKLLQCFPICNQDKRDCDPFEGEDGAGGRKEGVGRGDWGKGLGGGWESVKKKRFF